MRAIRVLSDEQFNQLTTDQKYLYINEMLRHIVASRPGAANRPPAMTRLKHVVQQLHEAEYAQLPEPQKIRYLEELIGELVATVAEAERSLSALRAAAGRPSD